MNQNSATEVIEPVSITEGDGINTDNSPNGETGHSVNSHADNSSTEGSNSSAKESESCDSVNAGGCVADGCDTGDCKSGACAKMTLFISKFIGRKSNVSYPYKAVITSLDALKQAVRYDHVMAKYKDGKNKNSQVIPNYRSKKGFMASNCLPMDCDNSVQNPLLPDLTEAQWHTPEDVRSAFPNVPFYIVYSRNHMKEKDGKTARPKFHVYFPIRTAIKSIKKYEALKKVVLNHFPAFDDNAIDGARFFFGVDDPKVEYFAGDVYIDDFLASDLVAADFKIPKTIPTGDRNNSLFELALKALKHFGETLAFDKFVEASNNCEEPLPTSELKTIWESALNYYHSKIETSKDYVSPQEFNKALLEAKSAKAAGSAGSASNGGEDSNNDEDWDGEDADDKEKKLSTDDVREALNVLGIKVRLNLITGKVDITGMPEDKSKANAAITLPTVIRDYFAITRNLTVSRQFIEDSLINIEDENRFNPVEDMLKETKHDGEDRIKVLYDILSLTAISTQSNATEQTDTAKNTTQVGDEATDEAGNEANDSADGEDIAVKTRRKAMERVFLTKWLHQCVAMALNIDEDGQDPYGAEGVLVLQSKQGMGKTMFFRKLAVNTDWFAEGVSIDTDNKDSIIQATGRWISELGELDSTLKREQSALKGFITAIRDTYRQPYARVATDKPRRTSFCGTVNPKNFLNDETGSRRFWVIHPDFIDVQKLKALDKDWFCQLWAQVYEQLYLPDPQGFRLTDNERAFLERENVKYSKPLPGEIEILDKYCWDAPIEVWDWKKTTDVLNDISASKTLTASAVGKVLTKLMEHDKRIKHKIPGNVSQYFLPPLFWDEKEEPPLVG